MTANFVANGHAPLPHLGALRVQGADAISFLQGQLTQDFALLKPDHARLAAWCSPQGRMLVSFVGFQLHDADEPAVLLVLWRDRLEAVLKRLRMFVLRSKVQISDVSDTLAIHGLLGSTVAELAPAVSRPWQRLHTAQADVVALWPAAQTARALWVGSSGQEPPAGDLLDTATWLQSEVMSGVAPVMTATADAYVPQMLNYESVDGVNFKKGCYPGQEVVARSQFRGTLKQRAYVGQVFGQALNGDEIWVAGADGSHVGSVALAAPLIAGHTDVIASIKISALNQSLAIGSPEGPALTQLHLPYALAQDI